MKKFLIKLFLAVVIFVAIDAPWIFLVVTPLYKNSISAIMRAEPVLLPAVLFYFIYIAVLLYITKGLTSKKAGITAFLFGIAAYATFTLTNMSVLEGWTWGLVIGDILWGGFLTFATLKLTNLIIKDPVLAKV